jgi:hypothetical protein
VHERWIPGLDFGACYSLIGQTLETDVVDKEIGRCGHLCIEHIASDLRAKRSEETAERALSHVTVGENNCAFKRLHAGSPCRML